MDFAARVARVRSLAVAASVWVAPIPMRPTSAKELIQKNGFLFTSCVPRLSERPKNRAHCSRQFIDCKAIIARARRAALKLTSRMSDYQLLCQISARPDRTLSSVIGSLRLGSRGIRKRQCVDRRNTGQSRPLSVNRAPLAGHPYSTRKPATEPVARRTQGHAYPLFHVAVRCLTP